MRYLAIFFCLSLLSCNNFKIGGSSERKYTLKETGNLFFESDTLFSSDYVFSIDYNFREKTISFLDGQHNRVLIFNEDGKQIAPSVITFPKDGPNGIGQLLPNDRHLYISQDSILIFNSMAGRVFLCDSRGKPFKKYQILDFDNIRDITTYPHNFQSPLVKDGYVYFPCLVSKYTNNFYDYRIILKLNMETGEVTKGGQLPDEYNHAFWGEAGMYMVYLTYNENNNQFIGSFPISEKIMVYDDHLDVVERKIMASNEISEVKPYDKNVSAGFNYKEYDYYIRVNEASKNTSQYLEILFDSKKKLYFRLNKLKLDTKKVRLGKTGRDFTISIFDENFKKVGETDTFDGNIFHLGQIFLTSKGIAIGRKDLNAADENHIHFSLFEAKKINE